MSVADQSCSIGSADEANVDTLELELTPDEMMALTRAAGLRQEVATSLIESSIACAPAAARDRTRVSVQIAVALTLVVAEVGAVWELYSVSNRPVPITAAIAQVHLPAGQPSPPVPPAERPRVRFTNPFDASEIFEFPPGTSETEAHDAVADLLLQRARERRPLIAKMKRVLRADIRTPRATTAQNSSRPHE